MGPKDDSTKYPEEYNVVVYEDASNFDTVLEQINKVMEEIQRQRSEFKAELEGINRSLKDKHLCSCESNFRGSQLSGRIPISHRSTYSGQRTAYRSHHKKMSEQEAAKTEVKEEVVKKEDVKKEEKIEE